MKSIVLKYLYISAMIKTLFFGHLPLGWKRLLRVITFGFFIFYLFLTLDDLQYHHRLISEGSVGLISTIVISMSLSYVVSGFILQGKNKSNN